MPTYKYRAKKDAEAVVEGHIEASSEKVAVERLSLMGYLPIHLEEEAQEAALSKTSPRGVIRGRIKSSEVTVLSRQLASLLKSGVPVLKAIDVISEQSEDYKLKAALRQIHTAIKEGSTFSSAFLKYPNIFAPIYIAIIRSGEDSGALPDALERIADYRSKQEEMLSRFRMALAYPGFMALVGTGTVVFMLTFVMPRMMRLFSNMGQNLPLPTRILIAVSSLLQQWWPAIAVFLAVFIFVFRSQAKTRAGKLALSSLSLRLPIFGKFILKAELARFSRTLELLIKNGISILKAIDTAIPVLENELLKNNLRQSYKELEQGGSFGRSLKKVKAFPLFMSNLIIIGEESGRLADSLSEVANSYERDTDESIKTLASLLEPLMILVMGLIVGFIVVAMLLPVFELNPVM